ncbi:putative glycosyltransferase C06E1.7 [Aphelenchoides besseyi]|nr:putative glycosyltransferase C06E1.7 [Aphelenchoides besseyi]
MIKIPVHQVFLQEQTLYDKTSFLHNWTHYDKFVSNYISCAGVANILFRLASLYGVAKQMNRAPCLYGVCIEDYHVELYSMFPNLQRYPLKTRCWEESATKNVAFAAPSCWKHDNVSRLNEYKEHKFIDLKTDCFQSYKFFHYARQDILTMFNFSSGMNEMVNAYAHHLFDDEKSVKVCAHMRRGDFVGAFSLLPTEESFMIPAMKFLITSIKLNQSNSNVDVLLLSDDFGFASDIKEKIKRLNVANKILISRELNRIENINLAARHCDYMLLTCSGSTFGWWMSYLMPEEKQQNVYYNSLFFKPTQTELATTFREEDFFPPDWKRLVLNKEKKEVFVEDRRKPLICV